MAVEIDSIVDVGVSLGGAPVSAASFATAAYLADLTDATFPDAYRVYTSLDGVKVDFAESSKTYKFALALFSGKFRPESLYVIKYRTAGTVLTATNALSAVRMMDTKPYWIASDTRVDATITALASYCEAEKLMFVTSTQQAGALVPATTTDIISVLKAAGADHSFCLYSGGADNSQAEGAVIGAIAGLEAGTTTLEFKTLMGIVADNLNDTQVTSLLSKNGAHYQSTAGVNCLYNSKVASGQFIDTIVFADWLKARLGESIFGMLKRESDSGRKVNMDESGFAKIKSAISEVLSYGKLVGSISADMEPVIRIPKREDIPTNDRANRILPNVVVELLYTNGVHKVKVRAFVTI